MQHEIVPHNDPSRDGRPIFCRKSQRQQRSMFAMKMNPQGICRLRKASKTALVGAAEDGLGQRARFSKPFKELRMATFSARAETVETKPVFHNAFKRTRRLIPMPRWGSRLRRVREEMASRKRGGVDRRTPSPSGSDHYSRQPS
jgi:putative SOS response-associated peptidase YedK